VVSRILTPCVAHFPYTTLFRSLSGGVDSSVAAALIHRAIGKNLHCIFVDNGLLRIGDREKAEHHLAKALGLNLKVADASKLFLRSEEHTSELQSLRHLVCRLLL